METVTETVKKQLVDKKEWGEGPWQSEPDRIEFEHAGLPCLITRHEELGHLCGYVAVPPGHPLHGKSYSDQDERANALLAHGGITYTNFCQGKICHVPKPGEPDDVWWFGFDCGHWSDLSPAAVTFYSKGTSRCFLNGTYRDLTYVRANCEKLAEQLAAVK